MAETYEIRDLNLPENSEIGRLFLKCPEIELRRFAEGEYLIRETDESLETFLVIDGGYVVERSDPSVREGSPQIITSVISDLSNPSFVGEMAYLGGGFRTASVRSAGRTFTFCLKPDHMEILIEEFPFFTKILCKQFTQRLMEANDLLRIHHERTVMETKKWFLEPGEILFKEGEKASSLFQLVQGILRCADEEEGEPLTIDGFVEPLSYFKESTWPKTVKAETRALVVEVSLNSKLAFTRNYPGLVLNLLQNS